MTITANLAGRTAFITGASSGFGSHFAKVLSRAGASVVVAARRKSALDALVAEIQTAGGSATAVPLDVTNGASISAAVAAIGKIDILVNNAGVTNAKATLEQTEGDFDWIIDTNLKGSFFVATAVARSMQSRGEPGSIINIASILGLRQQANVAPYAISKAGVIQMTKQLALEFARYQIRVNALAPGYFLTDLNREYFAADAGKAMIKRIPQRRLGQLADLDGPLLLLASDSSGFMTGAVIAVDGGHLLSGL
jgi:NAD(P)-dependent dehydrogenase (short-subunit alcohol dehydrogenase family)